MTQPIALDDLRERIEHAYQTDATLAALKAQLLEEQGLYDRYPTDQNAAVVKETGELIEVQKSEIRRRLR
jgi:hypothetical protein